MRRVCVFCGSNVGGRPAYEEAARRMGAALAERGLGLVYGGGNVGLMGAVADAALEAGGEVIGVIPGALVARELAHERLTELRVVDSMHERKATMAELAGAFIAMPGGYGTLEEFAEVLTWVQLGLHRKACGLLNVEGYYDPLLAFFDRAVSEGFVPPANRALVLEGSDPDRLLDAIEAFEPPALPRWIERDET